MPATDDLKRAENLENSKNFAVKNENSWYEKYQAKLAKSKKNQKSARPNSSRPANSELSAGARAGSEASSEVAPEATSDPHANPSKKLSFKNARLRRAAPATLVLIIAVIAVMFMFFAGGNLVPDAISERLIEATDVQYADAVESKKIVFAQALRNGDIPDDTTRILNEKGIKVGYLEENSFVENNKSGRDTCLQMPNGTFVTSDIFYDAVSENPTLYAAFTAATYGRAAYYYDETANEVFRDIGVTRNDFSEDSDFSEVMGSLVSSENDVKITSTSAEASKNEDGTTSTEYKTTSISANDAESFVNNVANVTKGENSTSATMSAAASLNTADAVAKDQKSSQLFVAFMENISKMKAGEGNDSKINEALNYFTSSTTSSVVNTSTGEVIESTGSMAEAPSLYALLSGEKVDVASASNYSSDAILKTTESRLGIASASQKTISQETTSSRTTNSGTNPGIVQLAYASNPAKAATLASSTSAGLNAVSTTFASVASGIRATISRWFSTGTTAALASALAPVVPTISSSLIGNTYEQLSSGGVLAGQWLARGAVTVSGTLATVGSGGAIGDEAATLAYLEKNSEVLAMDAAAEREALSPFDLSSKNTFFGSLAHKIALFAALAPGFSRQVASQNSSSPNSRSSAAWGQTSSKTFSLSSGLSVATSVLSDSVKTLSPLASAAEDQEYLATFGDCESTGSIGGVATAECADISTFDTSTLGNILSDSGFISFLNENTTFSGGSRAVVENSPLDYYIRFNNARTAPVGVVDVSILSSLISGSRTTSFISDGLASIMVALDTIPENYRRLATGEAFLNSSSNPDWQTYKYAQRYASLARAVSTLRQYSDDETAYASLEFFEGPENPVFAVLRETREDQSLAAARADEVEDFVNNSSDLQNLLALSDQKSSSAPNSLTAIQPILSAYAQNSGVQE